MSGTMNGHQLIKMLQDMGEAALNLPIKVPYHQQYDSDAGLEDLDTIITHTPAPWTKDPQPYISLHHGTDGSEI